MKFIIILFIVIIGSNAQSPKPKTKNKKSQGMRLEDHLRRKNYDINESPKFNKSPTDINVQIFINSFGSLNAANMDTEAENVEKSDLVLAMQDYSVDCFLRQRWEDPRLNRSSNLESITIMDKEMQDKLWKPDTFFENVKDAVIHSVTMPNILLRLYRDGGILYSMRVKMTLSCNLQLHQYPLDSQACYLALASYANTDNIIKYHWLSPAVDKPGDFEIAQFTMLKIEEDEQTYIYQTGNFSGLIVRFYLRRQNGYHILQTYVPTILIVSISWVSFWLDPNAVPGRVSLGVTTLLTLTTLASGIRSQLPPVSYVKAIDVWVGMCMIMVFGALLEFTLVNWLANKKVVPGAKKCKIPGPKDDTTVEGPATYKSHARAFDRFSRLFFPGAFLLFNLYYWPYYLLQQKDLLPIKGVVS